MKCNVRPVAAMHDVCTFRKLYQMWYVKRCDKRMVLSDSVVRLIVCWSSRLSETFDITLRCLFLTMGENEYWYKYFLLDRFSHFLFLLLLETCQRDIITGNHAVCLFKPSYCVSALMQAFDDIDVDKSGRINRKELRAALQLIGQNPTNADMQRYMPDGKMDFTQAQFKAWK